MTSFHVPTEDEIRAQRAALGDPKVVPLFPQPRPALARSRLVALSAAALAAAEIERNMCLEAAASMAEMLGRRIRETHPALVTRESVAECLVALAGRIRSLKGDEPPADPAPAGPGDAA